MTYLEIAKQLLTEELEHIKKDPKQSVQDFNWGIIDLDPKELNRLVVRERAVKVLADKIKIDHELALMWESDGDGSCKYNDLMVPEYFDEIMKDFMYQLKSYLISIPIPFEGEQ